MEAIPDVVFIQGDFRETETLCRLQSELEGRLVDGIVSDMAPNMSGIRAVDVPRAFHLVELALELAQQTLRPGGSLVAKAFSGSGFEGFLRAMRASFSTVSLVKPKASRSRSPETYVVGTGFKAGVERN
jgi:23S rRNA (uridine2552-2'-O)-methyltransferase